MSWLADKRMNSSDRKNEILNVVLDIIFEEGFYNLTIRNIADRIGISEAAIYRHFKSKKQIIERLTDLLFKNSCWQEIDYSVSSYDLLKRIMRGQFQLLQDNPRLTGVIFQEEIFREYDEIGEKIKKFRDLKEKKLIKIIESGKEKGEIAEEVEPEIFALLYMGSIRVSVIKWKENDFSGSLVGKEDKILEELFRMLKV